MLTMTMYPSQLDGPRTITPFSNRFEPASLSGPVLIYNDVDKGVGECVQLPITGAFALELASFLEERKAFPRLKLTVEIIL